jgi:hypothetical protein
MRIDGLKSTTQLVNSEFDAASRSISSFDKWRGGDASSSGTRVFREGEFVLTRYEVDPTYDGELSSQTVVDYKLAK